MAVYEILDTDIVNAATLSESATISECECSPGHVPRAVNPDETKGELPCVGVHV